MGLSHDVNKDSNKKIEKKTEKFKKVSKKCPKNMKSCVYICRKHYFRRTFRGDSLRPSNKLRHERKGLVHHRTTLATAGCNKA